LPIANAYRPIYKITIKNPSGTPSTLEFNSWYFKGKTPGKQKQLNKLAIYVDRDLSKKLDLCMISISLRGGSLTKTAASLKVTDIKAGAEVKVYLGYAKDEKEDVIDLTEDDLAFVGIVDEVEQSFEKISITAYSNAYKIIMKKASTSDFPDSDWKDKEKSSKEIITKLLGSILSLDSGSYVKDGLKFKSYTPDDEQTIYDNIKQLADYNGFNFYLSKAGKVRFHEAGSSGTARKLEYGKNILEYKITMTKPPYDSVEVELNYKDDGDASKVVPYDTITGNKSATGAAGKKKTNKKKITFGMASDKATADKVAMNLLKTVYVPETGEVKTLGNTSVDLGDKLDILFGKPLGGVSLTKRAAGAEDLEFMERKGMVVTRVAHRFGNKSGFVSVIGWKKEWEVH
jgi:hypothetical protein